MKKYLFALLIVVGIATAQLAHGATLLSQTIDSATATPNSTALGAAISGGKAAKSQALGTGLTGTMATTTIYISDTGGLSTITPAVTLECYDDSAYTTYNAGCSTQTNLPVENGTGKHLVSVPLALTFDSSKYYRLGVGCTAHCSGGTNPNLVTYGSASQTYAFGDFTTGMNITDLYFELDGSFGDSIQITYPASGSTNNDNFGLWRLSYSQVASSTNNTSAIVIYVNSTSTVSSSNYNWFDQEVVAGTAGLHQNIAMNRLNGTYVSSTIYYAKAYLFSDANPSIASSAVISFTIGDVSQPLSFSAPTPNPLVITPAQNDFQTTLRQKIPFAWFYDISDIVASYATSSEGDFPSLTIHPFPASSSLASVSFTALSSSSFTYVGATNISTIREAIKYILWLGFLTLIFFQGKKLFHKQ